MTMTKRSMSKSRAALAVSMLADRLSKTSFGWTIGAFGVDSKGIADYIRQHKDLKDAIDLWLEDVKELMKDEDENR